MNGHQRVVIDSTELWLLAEKAVFWPDANTLLVADAHFGKAAVYRSLGQPVPHGTTDATLRVLGSLMERFPGANVVFLGDFLHGPGALAPTTSASLSRWRDTFHDHAITVIRGNHDQRAGDPPAALGFNICDGPLLEGPFALQHEPVPHPTHHVLAGHIHPVFQLRGRGRQRLRLPCFQIGQRMSLLPAFGAFTGGYAVGWRDDIRLYVVADGQVWPLDRP